MGKGTPFTDEQIQAFLELRKIGKTNKEIASIFGVSADGVANRIGSDKPRKKENESGLSNIEQKLDDLIYEIKWLKNQVRVETIEFKDIGFQDKNGTFCSEKVKVNINNRRVQIYVSREKNWECFDLDWKIIEAIWTEIKLRGWCLYK